MSGRPPDEDFSKLYESLYLKEDDPGGPVFRKDKRLARDVAARFSRGNVKLQNSGIIDREFVQRIQSEMTDVEHKQMLRRAIELFSRLTERK